MAIREIYDEHWDTGEGDLRAGGVAYGEGFAISWERLKKGGGAGARPQEVLVACIKRIKFYESSRFSCQENREALAHLETALKLRRESRDILFYNFFDENHNPAGGFASGVGFCISWQNGPLGAIDSPDRKEPNGAFVETVISAIIKCAEYEMAQMGIDEVSFEKAKIFIYHLSKANEVLNARTQRRIEAKTEGTHEGK